MTRDEQLDCHYRFGSLIDEGEYMSLGELMLFEMLDQSLKRNRPGRLRG